MALPKILDDALDALVVPGFSRIGYLVRAGQFAPLDHNALTGKTIVITGPTSGLGKAAAQQLAAMGADLILVGRSVEKLERTKSELVRDSDTQKFHTVIADMGDSSLHALIHNAGALLKERSVTAQGFETTIATHVLGPHQMTTELLPLLKSSAGRVITVSSGGMYAASLPNVSLDESPEMTPAYYDGTRQYAIAKRIQVTLNEMWAIREPQVSFAAMHPGWADTPGVQESLPAFRLLTKPLLRSAEQGADTICWLASRGTADDSGKFWCDRAIRSIHRLPRTRKSDTPEVREALLQWCDLRIKR
ncbi:MAG: SDR family NAD(P)-dependent oxidoreductase [Ilumatobacteraceae bacterium]|nr:SDR family NAD(P)-dependent oxidoreductase [Ilumatobacteraceae bacterium]